MKGDMKGDMKGVSGFRVCWEAAEVGGLADCVRMSRRRSRA